MFNHLVMMIVENEHKGTTNGYLRSYVYMERWQDVGYDYLPWTGNGHRGDQVQVSGLYDLRVLSSARNVKKREREN
jgi:hypothetical protein